MEFKNTEVWGFEHALRGMRNPYDSWDKSDSKLVPYYIEAKNERGVILAHVYKGQKYQIGKKDLALAQSLIKNGTEHCKFLRQIHVSVDIDMPRYWWSEADTYKFNTKNSCSSMHKLLNNSKPITKDLFVICEEDEDIADLVIARLENLRQESQAINGKDENAKEQRTRLLVRAKRLLLEGFLQLRTFDTTYAEIRNMYFQRKKHPLKEEWQDIFCKWAESLPYSKELICYE